MSSFEILAMSEELEALCAKRQGKAESILELSSPESRDSFEGQLQLSINGASNTKKKQKSSLTFNLMGLLDVSASLILEHDDFLQCWVASIHIHSACQLATSSMDESNRLSEDNLLLLHQQHLEPLEQLTMESFKAEVHLMEGHQSRGVSSCARSRSASTSSGAKSRAAFPLKL